MPRQSYIRTKIPVQTVDLCTKALEKTPNFEYMDLRHDATVPKYPEPLVSDVMWGQ